MLGAGTSGQAATRLLLHQGWQVRVLDAAPEPALAAAATSLRALGATVNCGGTLPAPDETPALAVLSPGFDARSPLRAAAAQRGCPLLSELDLGARFLRCPILAVTGSKGKSSLVKLLADTLTRAGRRALPGGNYGTALCTLAEEPEPPLWAVVECSSFQLETSREFHPRSAILLNLSPDHLDRHGSLAAYRDAKLRLFARQTPGDLALLPAAAELQQAFQERFPRPFETFGAEDHADWRYVPDTVLRRADPAFRVALERSYFDNPVLGPAAAAGTAALWHAGLTPAEISEGFRHFIPLPHRMQPVAETGGVRFVNDSKATSLTALRAAVHMSSGNVRLIAGGRLKEEIWLDAKELLTSGVKKVYLIGESASDLRSAWEADLAVETCGTLERAVTRAAREAEPGDTVLLSPGTASFDQFNNYQERGTVFMSLVQQWKTARATRPEETEE